MGQQLFLLGANGTGKSSLVYSINRMHRGHATHVSAHRQNWFQSESSALSRETKNQIEIHSQTSDLQPQARWRDDYSSQRPSIAMYDLIDAENQRSREISAAFEKGDIAAAQSISRELSPIAQINLLLRIAAFPIRLELRTGDDVRAVRTNGIEYGVSELSDGERNALLVAANVLRAKPGALIIIDEPERHLHRSIISPLLTQLFTLRQDCAFIVSTHEVMLPIDNPNSQTVLVRSCLFSGATAVSWEADLIPAGNDIDEAVRRDILGARRVVLFVEGTEGSLDRPLYASLFPNLSVISKSSCREVEQSVIGMRASTSLHWLHAFGIIDSDGRDNDDVQRLLQSGIHALPVFSVEALYYHPSIQSRIAERFAAIGGGNAAEQLANAAERVLEAAAEHADRLSARVAEKSVREMMLRRIPTLKEIVSSVNVIITLNTADAVANERGRIDALIAARDIAGLIARYPLRETPALDGISRALGFTGRPMYEAAVIKLLFDSPEARSEVRAQLGPLAAALDAV